MQYILASASPRRAELLRLLGVDFSVVTSGFDEDSLDQSDPAWYVEAAAKGKAAAVRPLNKGIVIAADTVVVVDGRILGKPKSREDAVDMLMALSGRTHRVITGVCVTNGEKTVSFADVSEVDFLPLDKATAERYAATGECDDKAGAYGIQGLGAVLVKGIRGDYHSVMGLPVSRVAQALREFGYTPFSKES